jgi:hypothetical protein
VPPLQPPPPPPAPTSGPLTVDIISHASVWTWLGPVLAFVGTLVLFGGTMITLWRTNKSADRRHGEQMKAAKDQHDADMKAAEDRYLADQSDTNSRHHQDMAAAQQRQDDQLAAMRAEGRADRTAQRNDRFREEVANLIGEKWNTVNAAYELADAVGEFQRTNDDPDVAPKDRFWKARGVRDKYTPQLNKVEHLAIRASLLTNDAETSAMLDEIRTVAQMWKDLVANDPYETFIEIRDRLETAFNQLETLTRKLVTSDGTS